MTPAYTNPFESYATVDFSKHQSSLGVPPPTIQLQLSDQITSRQARKNREALQDAQRLHERNVQSRSGRTYLEATKNAAASLKDGKGVYMQYEKELITGITDLDNFPVLTSQHLRQLPPHSMWVRIGDWVRVLEDKLFTLWRLIFQNEINHAHLELDLLQCKTALEGAIARHDQAMWQQLYTEALSLNERRIVCCGRRYDLQEVANARRQRFNTMYQNLMTSLGNPERQRAFQTAAVDKFYVLSPFKAYDTSFLPVTPGIPSEQVPLSPVTSGPSSSSSDDGSSAYNVPLYESGKRSF